MKWVGNQSLDLCHSLLKVDFKVVDKEDLPICKPLKCLNLYNFDTRNLLDLAAMDLAAFSSAVFFLL